MNVLVIGAGGREHALCYKLKQSPLLKNLYCSPGNAGIFNDDVNDLGMSLDPQLENLDQYIDLCLNKKIDLVIIGPEKFIDDGLTDALENAGLKVFAPNKKAAIIESSKVFSKEMMKEFGILTADANVFDNAATAEAFLLSKESTLGFVLKQDGLAAGKGVFVCLDREEAILALKNNNWCGQKILIEELLKGREVSAFAICDGEDFVPLGLACDYKRIFDNDKGPNTGGMGAYSPVDWLKPQDKHYIWNNIIPSSLKAIKEKDIYFKGILFVGIMVTDKGPYVLEYNVRFGDPETQALLPCLATDILPLLTSAAAGGLGQEKVSISYRDRYCVHVIKAAEGYPDTKKLKQGEIIERDTKTREFNDEQVKFFFAGVDTNAKKQLITRGGRVLGVSGFGENLADARSRAYEASHYLSFKGQQMRTDIGKLSHEF